MFVGEPIPYFYVLRFAFLSASVVPTSVVPPRSFSCRMIASRSGGYVCNADAASRAGRWARSRQPWHIGGPCARIPGLSDFVIPPSLDECIAGIADGLALSAARRLGNLEDANDAVQETLARLWVRLRTHGVPPIEEVAPIAWGIARHVIADMLRERGRQVVDVDRLTAIGPSALDAIVSAEDARAARDALGLLPPADRELLIRCYVNGERIVEIAAATGEPAERLRKRKSRAMARLAAAISPAIRADSHETPPVPMEKA
jgi:RNA polymerase sigma-70 factor (ECF subfamily)